MSKTQKALRIPSETFRNDLETGHIAAARSTEQLFTDTHASALRIYSHLNEVSL